MKFIILVVFTLLLTQNAFSKNILDYYLSIPTEKLKWVDPEGKKFDKSRRLSVILIKDIDNGYIKIKGDDGSMETSIALFKFKSGDLIAITREGVSVQQFSIFMEKKKKWIEVTNKIFPKWDMDFLIKKFYEKKIFTKEVNEEYVRNWAGTVGIIVLPREGTDIKVISGIDTHDTYGKLLFEIKFDGTKFNIIQ